MQLHKPLEISALSQALILDVIKLPQLYANDLVTLYANLIKLIKNCDYGNSFDE